MIFNDFENGITVVEAPGISLDEKAVARLYKLAAGCDDEMEEMLESAASAASPAAMFRVAGVEFTDDGFPSVDGTVVRSELMARNFRGLSRAFPYICTVGKGLEEWSLGYADDPLAGYWADEVKKEYLYAFVPKFRLALAERFAIKGKLPSMNPGSLEKEWPISGQEQLFSMLGGKGYVKETIGVTLTDSFLMLPSKTVSGISFESEKDYENCMFCPRVSCPGRRAPYKGNK